MNLTFHFHTIKCFCLCTYREWCVYTHRVPSRRALKLTLQVAHLFGFRRLEDLMGNYLFIFFSVDISQQLCAALFLSFSSRILNCTLCHPFEKNRKTLDVATKLLFKLRQDGSCHHEEGLQSLVLLTVQSEMSLVCDNICLKFMAVPTCFFCFVVSVCIYISVYIHIHIYSC